MWMNPLRIILKTNFDSVDQKWYLTYDISNELPCDTEVAASVPNYEKQYKTELSVYA